MSTGLHGYPIDYAQLNRARKERAARKTRRAARGQSRSLALWRTR